MSQEGCETSNGVNYTYKFFSSTWNGCYECRVHRIFLDHPGTRIMTKEFLLENHAWQLELKHCENGDISAYTHCRGRTPVTAHHCYTVVNPMYSSNQTTVGGVSTFKPDAGSRSWGSEKLASAAEIKAKKFGFLEGDSFTVILGLRVKTPSNEHLLTSSDGTSVQCTWKLKDLDKSGKMRLVSDGFKQDDSEWKVVLYPHGGKPTENDMSLYLYYYGHAGIHVDCTLSVMNQHQGNIVVKKFSKRFEKYAEGYGFLGFLSAEALEKRRLGFLMDRWFTLSVLISIHGQQNPPNPRSMQPQQQPQQLPDESEDGLKCVLCLDKAQTSGVLHGETAHKCYCEDCAEYLERQETQLNCPICGEEIDLIIKYMV